MKGFHVEHERELINVLADGHLFVLDKRQRKEGRTLLISHTELHTLQAQEKCCWVQRFLVMAEERQEAERWFQRLREEQQYDKAQYVCWMLSGEALLQRSMQLLECWTVELEEHARLRVVDRQARLDRMMPPHMILPSLFLTDFPNVSNARVLSSLGLTRIVNASRYRNVHEEDERFRYLEVDVSDIDSESISDHFESVFQFLQGASAEAPVVVHCQMGVSRSATLVIAYLIKQLRLTLRQAVWLTRSCRSVIFPNAGFLQQLLEFEEKTLGQASIDMKALDPRDYLTITEMFRVDEPPELEPLRPGVFLQRETQLIWRHEVVIGVMREGGNEELFH